MKQSCSDCGRTVMWVGTVRGKRMAMDALPDRVNGTYLLTHAKGANGTRLVIIVRALNDSTQKAALNQGMCLYKRHMCRERMERFEQAAA